MAKTNIPQFFREVRQEAAKVTWPTRRETAISTAMVVVMVVIAAVFFLFVDWLLATGIQIFIGTGR